MEMPSTAFPKARFSKDLTMRMRFILQIENTPLSEASRKAPMQRFPEMEHAHDLLKRPARRFYGAVRRKRDLLFDS